MRRLFLNDSFMRFMYEHLSLRPIVSKRASAWQGIPWPVTSTHADLDCAAHAHSAFCTVAKAAACPSLYEGLGLPFRRNERFDGRTTGLWVIE